MNADPLLELDQVSCLRGGRLLFEDLSLVVKPGGAALVTGPNGVGKSSLLRLAAGLLHPAAGTVRRACPAALADDRAALMRRFLVREAEYVAQLGTLDQGHHQKLAAAWSAGCSALSAAQIAELRALAPEVVRPDLAACP